MLLVQAGAQRARRGAKVCHCTVTHFMRGGLPRGIAAGELVGALREKREACAHFCGRRVKRKARIVEAMTTRAPKAFCLIAAHGDEAQLLRSGAKQRGEARRLFRLTQIPAPSELIIERYLPSQMASHDDEAHGAKTLIHALLTLDSAAHVSSSSSTDDVNDMKVMLKAMEAHAAECQLGGVNIPTRGNRRERSNLRDVRQVAEPAEAARAIHSQAAARQ